MVSSGELTSENATYALAGRRLERWHRIDDVARRDPSVTRRWDGTWELAIVMRERRSAADRLELRRAAAILHLAEVREGVWLRPDNLQSERMPTSRAVLEEQCARFQNARCDITSDAVQSLFSVDVWSGDAKRLIRAMDDEIDVVPTGEDETRAALTYEFSLSIAVVRHLQLDPLLPAAFLPEDWPAGMLRSTYRRLDAAFKQRMKRGRQESQR